MNNECGLYITQVVSRPKCCLLSYFCWTSFEDKEMFSLFLYKDRELPFKPVDIRAHQDGLHFMMRSDGRSLAE